MSEEYLKPSSGPIPTSTLGWVGVTPYQMGRHTYVSEFSHISQHTIIGSFCSIGNLCTIGAQRHSLECLTSFPFDEVQGTQKPRVTVVGSDVWVGCNSVIMAGVHVDHGAVIGAGAIVTRDVPAYAIVVGNPARVLRYRFPPEIIDALLETKWWDLPAEEIKKLPLSDPMRCIALIKGQG